MTSAVPTCIGLILDGNRRFARAHNVPTLEGHRRGADTTEKIVLAARDLGIKHVIAYGFSTENWKRSEEEVSYLMALFAELIEVQCARLREENIAVRFVGQRDRLPESLQARMNEAERISPQEPSLTFWICLSYGGRAEIAAAAHAAAQEGDVTEESIAAHLWTKGMPDPDLIIRTGGEERLSNFLLWQAAYSELFFTPVYWPEFSRAHLEEILAQFASRQRRLGA